MMQGSKRLLSKSVVLVVVFPFLSGCTWIAPGLHVNPSRLTPSLNSHDQIVQPKIQCITPKYLQWEKHHQDAEAHYRRLHYRKPRGFTADTSRYQYAIAPQDVLHITIWNVANDGGAVASQSMTQGLGVSQDAKAIDNQGSIQTSSEFIVDNSGNIFYPYLGNIKVSGKTTNQVRQLLVKKMSHYFQNPQITVDVAKFNSQSVAVTGAVEKPISLPITTRPLNLLTAITEAGGPIRCGVVVDGNVSQTCADLHDVEVHRGNKMVTVDLNKLVSIDGSSNNWILKNNDVVYVPNNNQSRVFVLGAVNLSGPFNMVDGQMTLREALGNARGVSTAGNPAYTYIIRDYHHDPKLFTLNLASADALNLAGEFDLKPGDIVFVSTSALGNFNEILQQFSPTLLTAVSIRSLARY